MIGFVADTICSSFSLANRAKNYLLDIPTHSEPQPTLLEKVDTVVHSVICEGIKNGIGHLALIRYKDVALNAAESLVPLLAKISTVVNATIPGVDISNTITSCKDALPIVSQIVTGIKMLEATALVFRISARSHQNWGETLSDTIQVASHWYQCEQLEKFLATQSK